ncbi:MAG: NfeD family protein [Candidatus Binatia bacterium]
MRTWIKYLLFQVPGWVLAALVLMGLRYWIGLPVWIAVGAFLFWVIKDFVFYPFLRIAYESRVKTGAEQLVGLRGVARENLSPHGYVHVRGELWRAEAEPGDRPILAGSPIRVLAGRGMTLIVAAETGDLEGSKGS